VSKSPKTTVNDILAELRTQLDAHGEIGGPKIARLRWPNVPASSWCRYVKQAREEWSESLRLRQAGLPASSIPTPDSPTAVVTTEQLKGAARGTINWVQQINAMLKQCDLLVRQSVIVEPTGVERVRNAIVLQQSIRARAAILKLAADREAVQYGAERIVHWERELVKELGRAIGKVRTEDQRVISNRVRRAIEGVERRRAQEREFLGGDMTPKAGTDNETTEISNDKPE
jgi:hypothetical protein